MRRSQLSQDDSNEVKLLNKEQRSDFYVYSYAREDGSFYYVGKGCGRRYLHTKNDTIQPPKDRARIKILAKTLHEHEASQLEVRLIELYGRRDLGTGNLLNRTAGGEGSSGRILSAVTIDKMRASISAAHARPEVKARHRSGVLAAFANAETKSRHQNACTIAQNKPETKAHHWKSALTRATRVAIKHGRASAWPQQ